MNFAFEVGMWLGAGAMLIMLLSRRRRRQAWL
jgi:hypothetical protein